MEKSLFQTLEHPNIVKKMKKYVICLVFLSCGLIYETESSSSSSSSRSGDEIDTDFLAESLRKLERKDLERVLEEAGIVMPPDQQQHDEEVEKHYETHLANQCKTVLMRSENLGPPLGDLEGSDLEERLKNGEDIISMIEIESKVDLGNEDSGSGDPESLAALDCECDTYKCQCRKMCFCQLQEAQFGGNVVPSPSEDQDPEGANIVDSQFKCTCDFESAPGTGALAGGTMDCDCKIADCACEKQCKCKIKK